MQLAQCVPSSLEPRVGLEDGVEAWPFGGVELVESTHEQEPCPKHVGGKAGLGALGAARDVATCCCEPGLELSDDVEPVQHLAGVAEPGADHSVVRGGAIGHLNLHSLHHLWP